MPEKDFIDYYEVLQISPHAEIETIRRVFKLLAVRVHPDNTTTGDPDQFRLLKQAYETLSDAEKRAKYDSEYEQRAHDALPVFELDDFKVGVDGEVNRRIGILCLLYNTRRANEDKPGLSIMELEKLMGFPREHLSFAVWYLKNRKYIESGESSDIIITSEGIDFLEGHLPTSHVAYKLLKGAEQGTIHMGGANEPAPSDASDAAGDRRTRARVVH